ncbi:NAD(P)H-dependent oxidoreductase [Carboxydothermus pertinax]|uniref:NADPH-dependent FMN reductase-like domain-containing protein n=1 Tax=Carboxydothermus pertinax TaxID=870242 RepID=A0A1L8CXZ2_9THEO|nr:NAD(P)H-dependent oxidoreductase [Carboxydothermus pertinax]GAV23806.1 hypothetical protein cpu_23160 [Carboxydothermus pertinax]
MKILGISFSARDKGNTDILVNTALRGAASVGASIEFIKAKDLNIENCRGCLSCVYKGKCPISDDLYKFIELVKSANGIVAGAPTYLFGPIGKVKTMTDRSLAISHFLEKIDPEKKFGITISVAGNPLWNPLGSEILNQFILSYGFSLYDFLAGYAPGPGEVLLNDELLENTYRLGKELVLALRKEKEPPKAQENQCPYCKSRLVKFEEGKIYCAICLAPAEIRDGKLSFAANYEPFWTKNHRINHINDWIIPSRDRFLSKIKDIKEKAKQLNI